MYNNFSINKYLHTVASYQYTFMPAVDRNINNSTIGYE
jgi:hypothetical protein